MKRIPAFLLALIVPNFCFGDSGDFTQETTFSYLQEYKQIMEHSLPVIEERVRQTNPTLVESTKNDTKEQKIVKYNNYLAQKAFDDYKKFFMWDIEQRGKQTGRDVKKPSYNRNGEQEYYWLDAGIMDSEQCSGGTYMAKNNSRKEVEKQLRDEREHTCLYPDGFEEYRITFQDYGMPDLYVDLDDKALGVHISYNISLLDKGSNPDNPNEILTATMFSVSENVYDYQEYHQWRNAEQQNVINGVYEYVPKEKQGCGSVFGCVTYKANYDKFKAPIQPVSRYKGIIHDRMLQYGHSVSGFSGKL